MENNDSGMLEEIFYRQFDIAQDRAQQARAQSFAGMDWNRGDSSVRMPEKNMATSGSSDLKTDLAQNSYDFLIPSIGEGVSYGNLLDANEFQWTDFTPIVFFFQA